MDQNDCQICSQRAQSMTVWPTITGLQWFQKNPLKTFTLLSKRSTLRNSHLHFAIRKIISKLHSELRTIVTFLLWPNQDSKSNLIEAKRIQWTLHQFSSFMVRSDRLQEIGSIQTQTNLLWITIRIQETSTWTPYQTGNPISPFKQTQLPL